MEKLATTYGLVTAKEIYDYTVLLKLVVMPLITFLLSIEIDRLPCIEWLYCCQRKI